MELQIGVKVLLKNKENKYLLLHHKKIMKDDTEPYWTIPGGRINPEEPILDGLKREIREETGLDIIGTPLLLDAQDFYPEHGKTHVVRLTFTGEASGAINLTLDPENDHSEYEWVTLEEAQHMHCDHMLVQSLKTLQSRLENTR